MKRKQLASALFGKARRGVLGLLYGHPEESYYLRQILRAVNAGQGTVQRELTQLAEAGIIQRIQRDRQVYFRANPQCPIYSELQGIILKTVGMADVLRKALSALDKKIVTAFVYGSMATGRATSQSDVDLMVIGSCRFTEVVEAIAKVQQALGREVNPTVYTIKEWREKLAHGHHFTSAVSRSEKLFIKGTADDLERLAP
jgi:predicted nucleotidyltransferase